MNMIRHWTASIRIGLTAAALLVVGGCGRPDPSQRPLLPDQVLDFTALYGKHCAGCHGAEGNLGAAPPLNDRLFLSIISPDRLTRIVTEGRKGTLMPGFSKDHGGDLTPRQIDVLVGQIRSRWGPAGEPSGPAPPVYSQAAARQQSGVAGDKETGGKLFGQICARCHGKEGKGGDDAGPLHSRAFLALISDQALRRIIITGRPDLGMPNYRKLGTMAPSGKPLTSDQIEDIVAYLGSWRLNVSEGNP